MALTPTPDLPYADAQTVAEFWPRVESELDDRRTAEREIKIDMLQRGRDGIEAAWIPLREEGETRGAPCGHRQLEAGAGVTAWRPARCPARVSRGFWKR